jgi:hypothetical protein
LLILAILAIPAIRFSAQYREALADDFAKRMAGDAALVRAETVLGGDAAHAPRPWTALQIGEIRYSLQVSALFGLSIGALGGYLPAPLIALHDALDVASPYRDVLALVFAVIQSLLAFKAAFLASYSLAAERMRPPLFDEVALQRLAAVGLGMCCGFLVTQTLPLMATDLPIFDRFQNISRVFAWPLLLGSVTESVVLLASCTLAAAIFAWPAVSTGTF